ncbi:portal protein [Microvirga sp. G4-2]|uniref:portal protein n=1 Tax=Microvirga sp. G4-2 TaxID=3434467 RepID=UPI0040441206
MATLGDKPKPLLKPRFVLTDRPKEPFAKRLAMLRQERDYHVEDWKEISTYIRPRRGLFTREEQRKRRSQNALLQNEAMFASRTCGNGMMSGISSQARPWFRLTTPDPALAEFSSVKQWLYEVTSLFRYILSVSNFYASRKQVYPDVADFGTAVTIIDPDYDDVVRFTVIPPGQYCLATDHKDRVNTLYREFSMTVFQVVERFGLENCSSYVRDRYDRGAYDELVDIVHVIEPNMQQVRGLKGPLGMPYVCVYYEVNSSADKLLSFKGYPIWPVASPRWDVQSGEVYGTGCGFMALPDAKGVQVLERRKAQAIDKLVTPPTQAPAGVAAGNVNHLPGGTTILPQVTAQGGPAIRPIYEQSAQGITAVRGEIDGHTDRIHRAYFSDLFLMLAQSDRREITAREIDERHEEKLLQLGPVLESVHGEDLNIVIDNLFHWCAEAKILPPPPKEVQGVELKVEFISILAQAQKAVAVGGIERLVGFVGNLAAARPDVLDKVDFDQAIDEYSDSLGTPPALVRSDDAVKEIRAANAAAAQQAQAAAAMPAAAQSAKVLSEARTSDGGSILDQVLGINQ